MPGWRRRCRRAVCWMDDLWSHSIREHPRALAPLRQFDLIISTTRHAVNLLQQTMERPCFALPEGVDCFRFSPFPHPPDRSIDVFCLGRRSAETHQALVAQARARRLYYVYDSLRSNLMYEIDEHRDLIAHHVQRCRYFLVQSARANPPEKSEGREEVGNRYFEGCAGGAILVGEIPRSPTVAEYFAWPDAIVQYTHGSRRIVEFLAELDAQPERRGDPSSQRDGIAAAARLELPLAIRVGADQAGTAVDIGCTTERTATAGEQDARAGSEPAAIGRRRCRRTARRG